MTKLVWGFEDIVEGAEQFDTPSQAYVRALEVTSVIGSTFAYDAVQALKQCGRFEESGEWIRVEGDLQWAAE